MMDDKSLAELKSRCLAALASGSTFGKASSYVEELGKVVGIEVPMGAQPNSAAHILHLIGLVEKGVKKPVKSVEPPKPVAKPVDPPKPVDKTVEPPEPITLPPAPAPEPPAPEPKVVIEPPPAPQETLEATVEMEVIEPPVADLPAPTPEVQQSKGKGRKGK